MKTNPAVVALLRRMDPAEVVLWFIAGMRDARQAIDRLEPVEAQRRALAGAHKARLAMGRVFTKAERAESAAWLSSNGFATAINFGSLCHG